MFETLHSERKYQGKVFSIRRDQISLPNGDTTNLDILEHSGPWLFYPSTAMGLFGVYDSIDTPPKPIS